MSSVSEAVPIENPAHILNRESGWGSLGYSADKNPVLYKHLKARKANSSKILLIGGVHGNETEGVWFMHQFCLEFVDQNEESPFEQEIFVIPVMNPDGFLNFQRCNSNRVDLNRNMPTKDWQQEYTEEKYYPGEEDSSEPETKIMVKLLAEYKPNYIISFHSWKPMINFNGPARWYAEQMKEKIETDMEITGDIGYPTPGSLGTYAGHERNIPTITFEFERGIPLEKVYPLARDGVLYSFN